MRSGVAQVRRFVQRLRLAILRMMAACFNAILLGFRRGAEAGRFRIPSATIAERVMAGKNRPVPGVSRHGSSAGLFNWSTRGSGQRQTGCPSCSGSRSMLGSSTSRSFTAVVPATSCPQRLDSGTLTTPAATFEAPAFGLPRSAES